MLLDVCLRLLLLAVIKTTSRTHSSLARHKVNINLGLQTEPTSDSSRIV